MTETRLVRLEIVSRRKRRDRDHSPGLICLRQYQKCISPYMCLIWQNLQAALRTERVWLTCQTLETDNGCETCMHCVGKVNWQISCSRRCQRIRDAVTYDTVRPAPVSWNYIRSVLQTDRTNEKLLQNSVKPTTLHLQSRDRHRLLSTDSLTFRTASRTDFYSAPTNTGKDKNSSRTYSIEKLATVSWRIS